MSLATVIRLEFAYPGVGVLAGDSLQYLSIATAHGVIMVFYMIMPCIFGAFGNFLLPTQLGVHDVAFPRLNSAAFWFLPGGLIMLAQLICTDRRYARMNCFNIRELQSILKTRFFTDLVNSHEHRTILDRSMIGLRFKNASVSNLELDITSFYNYGLHKNLDTTHYPSHPYSNYSYTLSSSQLTLLSYFNFVSPTGRFGFNYILFGIALDYLEGLKALISSIKSTLLTLYFYPTFMFSSKYYLTDYIVNILPIRATIFTTTSNFIYPTQKDAPELISLNTETLFTNNAYFLSEHSTSQRFTRFNAMFANYDYKTGHYLGSWESYYPYLFNNFSEIAKGSRRPSWYFSEKYDELASGQFVKFVSNFTGRERIKLSNANDWYVFHITPLDAITNFYYVLLSSSEYNSLRWQAFSSLNQKFSKMFLSSTTQQRVLAN